MASSIDATKPTAGAALTADVRNNFSAAKTEIEALQAADATLAPKGAVTSSGLTMSTERLLGRNTASTGAIEEITLGTNLSMSGTTLNATGGDFKSDGTVAMTGAIQTAVGTITSSVANGASAVGFNFNTPSYTTSGSLLARWQNNGVAKAWIDKDGVLATPLGSIFTNAVNGTSNGSNVDGFSLHRSSAWGFQLAASLLIQWSSNSTLYSTRDVGLGRNASRTLEINNSTPGTFGDLKLRSLISSGGVITLSNYTVATLLTGVAAHSMAAVTDSAASPAYRAAVTGGGSTKCSVYTPDGTNWEYH